MLFCSECARWGPGGPQFDQELGLMTSLMASLGLYGLYEAAAATADYRACAIIYRMN